MVNGVIRARQAGWRGPGNAAIQVRTSGDIFLTTAATLNPRSQRKPKGEGHARRAEILAAAERIFVEHG